MCSQSMYWKIYGKGEQQEELEKYAKELKISDSVKFMGQKENVQTVYSKRWCFCIIIRL